jgi:pyridoxal phosphate enzyme (YggS family)
MTNATAAIDKRIVNVRRRLDEAAARADRDPADITITAVSKTVDRATMQQAYDLGLRHFGENRVQDARAKLNDPMPADSTLHLIGQLQTNKAGHAVQLFQIVESVDRPSLVIELEKQAARLETRLPVFLQVNVAGEDQKAGCALDAAPDLARQLLHSSHLRLDGLMTMAPLVDDPELVRHVFRGLRELRDRLQQELSISLPTLSMGMTNDFPVAIEEGATQIRVGRAIFGS